MNLLERIKAQKAESISTDDDDLFVLTDSAPPPSLPLGQQRYELPDRALFLAIYEAALRKPYPFHVIEFREYKKWLLDGSCYVLNTFRKIDPNGLLALYLKHKPPDSADALSALAQLLWQIELFVPEEYQRDFEQIIIDEGKRL